MGKEVDGIDYLEGLVYQAGIQCTNIDHFLEFLRPHFDGVPFDRDSVMARIDEIIRTADRKDPKWYCVVKDLENIRRNAKENVLHPIDAVKSRFNTFVEIIRREFPGFQPPDLKIVDSFPKPYDKMDWIAMAPDQEDQEKYGIEPGIYIKKTVITPIYAEYILAHELTHKIVEMYDTHGFGFGIEEGIAELYAMYLLTRVYSPKTAANVVILDKKYGKRKRLSALYEFFTVLAYTQIYLPSGMDGIRAAIRLGRKGLKDLDTAILKGERTDFPSGNWDKKLEKAMRRYMATPNDLYVTAKTRYVADKAEVGDTIEMIAKKTGLSEDEIHEAISELTRLTLITVKDGKVTAKAEHILPYLRYHLDIK